MGGRLNEVLVPARFMLTLGHLVAVLMLDATKSANISRVLANDASNSQYQAAKFEVCPDLTKARAPCGPERPLTASKMSLFGPETVLKRFLSHAASRRSRRRAPRRALRERTLRRGLSLDGASRSSKWRTSSASFASG
mmetsp:Transcript_1125/g.4126  ORF Transcript_1125/g.4126 Transcript_1125/m.4126 type:complete len:138 (+) Transcript_1125:111-524(+)